MMMLDLRFGHQTNSDHLKVVCHEGVKPHVCGECSKHFCDAFEFRRYAQTLSSFAKLLNTILAS